MTLLLVFVGCLFTIFALWLTVSPFLGGAAESLRLEHLDDEIREIELLVAQRETLVKSLRELDFDRETEKLAPEDYERFRRRYENQAVVIMRRLDEIHGGRDWRERVEAELTERLGRPSQLAATDEPEEEAEAAESSADELSPDIATDSDAESEADAEQADEAAEADAEDNADAEEEAEAEAEPDEAAVADSPCGSCGEPLEPDDRFCSQCGAPVGLREATPAPVKSEASA